MFHKTKVSTIFGPMNEGLTHPVTDAHDDFTLWQQEVNQRYVFGVFITAQIKFLAQYRTQKKEPYGKITGRRGRK